MKTLLDFIPVLLFFASYKLHAWFGVGKDDAMFFATKVLIPATAVQMAVIYAIDRKLSIMHKVTFGMVLVFGSVTLALHDNTYIMWKPTVLYGLMSAGLAISVWVLKKNTLKALLGSQLALPDPVWHKLNVAWVPYTAFMALSNAFVASYFSEDTWANFKLWGYIFPLLFLVGQAIYIAPHLKDETTPRKDTPSP